jgi:phosphatidylglycerophosphatase C
MASRMLFIHMCDMKKKIHVFDFDGTITNKDSLTQFFRLSTSSYGFFIKYYLLSCPFLLLYYFGKYKSLDLKILRFKLFFSGFSPGEFHQYKDEFSQIHLPKLIRLEAFDNIIKLRKETCNDVVVVSGSFDIIIGQWCSDNNITYITNELKYTTANNVLTILANKELDCIYQKKVELLARKYHLFGFDEIISYGDSEGDFFLYAISDEFYHRPFN